MAAQASDLSAVRQRDPPWVTGLLCGGGIGLRRPRLIVLILRRWSVLVTYLYVKIEIRRRPGRLRARDARSPLGQPGGQVDEAAQAVFGRDIPLEEVGARGGGR